MYIVDTYSAGVFHYSQATFLRRFTNCHASARYERQLACNWECHLIKGLTVHYVGFANAYAKWRPHERCHLSTICACWLTSTHKEHVLHWVCRSHRRCWLNKYVSKVKTAYMVSTLQKNIFWSILSSNSVSSQWIKCHNVSHNIYTGFFIALIWCGPFVISCWIPIFNWPIPVRVASLPLLKSYTIV